MQKANIILRDTAYKSRNRSKARFLSTLNSVTGNRPKLQSSLLLFLTQGSDVGTCPQFQSEHKPHFCSVAQIMHFYFLVPILSPPLSPPSIAVANNNQTIAYNA